MGIGVGRGYVMVICMLLSGYWALAQSGSKVSGKLASQSGELLSFATVGLSRAADSVFVKASFATKRAFSCLRIYLLECTTFRRVISG